MDGRDQCVASHCGHGGMLQPLNTPEADCQRMGSYFAPRHLPGELDVAHETEAHISLAGFCDAHDSATRFRGQRKEQRFHSGGVERLDQPLDTQRGSRAQQRQHFIRVPQARGSIAAAED